MTKIILAETFWGWFLLFVPPVIVIIVGIIWAKQEDKRRKRVLDNYPKAFKPMKIGKVVDMKLDDFEDAISN